jgi:lysophospholipase L1-like esterase
MPVGSGKSHYNSQFDIYPSILLPIFELSKPLQNIMFSVPNGTADFSPLSSKFPFKDEINFNNHWPRQFRRIALFESRFESLASMPGPKTKSWISHLSLLAGGLLLGIIVFEIGIRLYLHLSYRPPLKTLSVEIPRKFNKNIELGEMARADQDPRVLYTLKPQMRGAFRGTLVQTNAFGFRDQAVGEKTSTTLRLLGLGDSTMFGWRVTEEESYLELLEAELQQLVGANWQIEFINTAVPGYNSVQEVATFDRHVNNLRPDAVLIQFDKNDLDVPLALIKPEFIWTPFFYLGHLFELVGGEFSSPSALRLLKQESRMHSERHEIAGWAAQAKAYRHLAETCRQRDIPLIVLTVYEDWLTIKLTDRTSRAHQPMVNLCNELKVPIIETHRQAFAYPFKNQWPYLSIVHDAKDLHPNSLGHALIAQAALPEVTTTVLRRLGLLAEKLPGYKTQGNTILRQITRSGLHPTQTLNGARINWTVGLAHFQFVPGGKTLLVTYHVRHKGMSARKPVKVNLRVDGAVMPGIPINFIRKQFIYTSPGVYTEALEIGHLGGYPLDFSIEVKPMWRKSPKSRWLGVALHPLAFK